MEEKKEIKTTNQQREGLIDKEEVQREEMDKKKNSKEEMKKIKKKKGKKFWQRKIFWLILILIFIIWFVGGKLKKVNEEIITIPEDFEEKIENYYGTLEGSISYPSEEIPPLLICAKEKKTKEEFCTTEQIESGEFEYGFGYELEVPVGSYEVYAQVLKEDGKTEKFKAYYSKFVPCGMTKDCKSHSPITVKVNGGEIKSDISPMDWLGD